MSDAFEPKILAFLCNWCSYAGADLAGVSRFQYPPTIRVIRTMCSGRVDPLHIVEGLKSGFDGVFVFGCHIGDCHYLEGNLYTVKRLQIVEQLLELSGIGRDRVHLRWVSAAEGQMFANNVKELSAIVSGLGAFDASEHALKLAAMEGALNSQRLRWLMGMDRQLTERENVYHNKVDEQKYAALLKSVTQEEFQKALILEVLRDGPQSVREISGKSGIGVYVVSQLLSDIERAGKIEFHGYEGTTPKFIRLAA